MDQMTTYAACAAVHNDDGEAERWFRALVDSYRGLANPSDWDEFRSALGESAATAGLPVVTVDQFVLYLDQQSGKMDIIADMANQGAQELLAAYRDWLAQPPPEQEGEWQDGAYAGTEGAMGQEAPPEEDEGAWYAFLQENGRYWDRTPEHWAGFRDWFLYTAAEAGVGTTATNFLDWAQEQPDPAAVFVQYGVTFDEDAPAEQADPTYDEWEPADEPASTEGGYTDQATTAEDSADDEADDAEGDAEELIDLTPDALDNLIEQRLAQAGDGDDEAGAVEAEPAATAEDLAGDETDEDADEGTEELIDLTPDALDNLIEQRLAQAGDGDDEAGAESAGARDESAAGDEAESLTVEEAVDQIAGDIIAEFRSQHEEFASLTDDDIRTLLAEVIAEEAGAAQPA